MNEKLKTVVTTVKTKWTDASKMAKILIISIPVVVIAIIIVLCVMLNSNKSTAVLFSGLSASESGEIASRVLADALAKAFPDISVKISETHTDCMKYA